MYINTIRTNMQPSASSKGYISFYLYDDKDEKRLCGEGRFTKVGGQNGYEPIRAEVARLCRYDDDDREGRKSASFCLSTRFAKSPYTRIHICVSIIRA